MANPTPEQMLAEIQHRIDEAEKLANEPTATKRDLDCFYMASGVLEGLAEWLTVQIILESSDEVRTLYIGWLGPCPHCGYEGDHLVQTEKGNLDTLYFGDQVECSNCGASGEIAVDDGAFVEWEDDEE